MNRAYLLACIGTALAFSFLSARGDETKEATSSQLPPAATKQGITYAADIQPIFEKSCLRCHGAEKPKARLRLDTLVGVLKGGEDGKVITAGNSAESQLVQSVAHVGRKDGYMPPPNNKAKIAALTKEQVGLIRAWIDQGAK
jgi:hypothetical protein